jgi:uncharacterized Zn-binding protein involved in type VI secretion
MGEMPVLTFGDRNEKHAPLILDCDETVLIEGRKTGVKSKSKVLIHQGKTPKEKHPINPIVKGDETVLVSGKPIGYKGVPDECKHQMIYVQCKTVLVKGG